jgi:hypothetical protein
LSAQGTLSAEVYSPEGREARISLTLFVDAVLPLRAPAKVKADMAHNAKAAQNAPPRSPRHSKMRSRSDVAIPITLALIVLAELWWLSR